jgi:hypothetical protein
MLVQDIHPANSQSGWEVDVVLRDSENSGTMRAWDSDWFSKKGDL